MSIIPLAEKLRPKSLDEFVGQEKIAGADGIIRKLLAQNKSSNFFPSIIFWGPPGSGKTTLARIISNELNREFHELSAVNASVKDIEAITKHISKDQPNLFLPPIIFLDEIHRFNKAQQDRLLPHVEKGNITLIGATTENPSFEVIRPLLSRARVVVFESLSETDLQEVAKKAIKATNAKIKPKAKKYLIEAASGDARVLLTVFEIAKSISKGTIAEKDIEEAVQRKQYTFDKNGEDFFNTISAYIKSLRASQTDAALYYLARMIEAGQDPKYIARRMIVFASEDIGMAQPTALVVANEVFRTCEIIGYPECAINLAHGTVYLASAKKDRSAYDAYFKALGDVKLHGNLPIPLNLRNAPTNLMKKIGYGKGYEMYTKESLLPEKLKMKKYYV